MRRADREVTDLAVVEAMLAAANVCNVAFGGGDYPYVVPLHYGYARENEGFVLYFHCAGEGEKIDRLRRDARVAFSIDSAHRLYASGPAACSYSMEYDCVMGQGEITPVEDAAEKRAGLAALMRQLVPGQDFAFEDAMLERTQVLRLAPTKLTAKRSREKAHDR